MPQFLGDIAFMLEVFALAIGLMILHRAGKDEPARLLKSAGWILAVVGVAGILCTSFYWLEYQSQGEFDSAYRDCPGMDRR